MRIEWMRKGCEDEERGKRRKTRRREEDDEGDGTKAEVSRREAGK